MVPGVPGVTGPRVTRNVMEELRPDGDPATDLPRPMGGPTVMAITARKYGVTLMIVLTPSTLIHLLDMLILKFQTFLGNFGKIC